MAKNKKKRKDRPDLPYVDTELGQRDINQDPRGFYDFMAKQAGMSVLGASPFSQWLNTEGYNRTMTDYNNARLASSGGELSFANYISQGGLGNTGNIFTSSSTDPATTAGGGGDRRDRRHGPNHRGGGGGRAAGLAGGGGGVGGSAMGLGTVNRGPGMDPAGAAGGLAGGGGNRHPNRNRPGGGHPGQRGRDRKDAPAAPAPSLTASLVNGMTGPQSNMNTLRQYYRALSPEQSGEYMPGYAFTPGRWSVYG